MCAPRGLYGFNTIEIPPDQAARRSYRKAAPCPVQEAQRNCAVPAPISNKDVEMQGPPSCEKQGSGFRGHAAALKREGKFLLVHGCGRQQCRPHTPLEPSGTGESAWDTSSGCPAGCPAPWVVP